MSAATYFANAQGTIIGSHADFRTVYGNAITNNYPQCTHGQGQVIELNGRSFRRILDSDLNLQRHMSSEVIPVSITPGGEVSTSRTPQSIGCRITRVKKTVHTTKVAGIEGTFTATTFELVDKNDVESFTSVSTDFLSTLRHRPDLKQVLDCVQKAATSLRSPFLHQLFAFSGPNLSTMIAHNELINGNDYGLQFRRQKKWIVYYYLSHTCVCLAFELYVTANSEHLQLMATNSLREDEAVVFPVVNRWRNWSLDLKTLSWHYDPASVAIDPPGERDLVPYLNNFPPLHQGTVQQLDTDEIVTCVEKSLSDVLCLVVSTGGGWIGNLSGYAKHGLLTFGSIVDDNKAGILAHLPSTPPLEWICRSEHPDVKASFSSSVPWRLDFWFRKPGNFQVTLNISWHVPGKDGIQLHNAYLCQSLPLLSNCNDVERVVYIDQVGFRLKATFHHNPTTSPTQAYLFVPPLPVEIINNMKCVRYPFPRPLFYWSHDPQGEQVIAEEKWEEFGIPKLEMKAMVGNYWDSWAYPFVQEHLTLKNCDLDGRQYAQDHGYPELIHASGGPNNIKPVDKADSDSQHESKPLNNSIALHPDTKAYAKATGNQGAKGGNAGKYFAKGQKAVGHTEGKKSNK
ncbi:hypothetical protein PQX77_018529 [Marasmius sp. AFHP31]|nr:hypothetical protein PQX77_018529 [Marasmius sp. AFHP31]